MPLQNKVLQGAESCRPSKAVEESMNNMKTTRLMWSAWPSSKPENGSRQRSTMRWPTLGVPRSDQSSGAILAITPNLNVARQMALPWSAHSVHSEDVRTYEEMVTEAIKNVRNEACRASHNATDFNAAEACETISGCGKFLRTER